MSRVEDNRLAALHGLRGLSAVGVAILFHYVHFGGTTSEYPFDGVPGIHWVHVDGVLLVDLFFLLSGIIFTHRYLAPVASGRVSGRDFFILRFSRLYPLHICMLVTCAAIEWTLLATHRPPVVYENADLYSFVMQALYLHMAYFGGWAFNAPTWSVSAEILAYWSFFIVASRCRKNYVMASVIIFLVALSIETTAGQTSGGLLMINGAMARAVVGFYAGSLGYLLMRKLEELGYAVVFGRLCLGFFTLVLLLAWLFGYDAWIGLDFVTNCLAVFAPLIFACLCVRPLSRLLSVRPLAFLGDISYSIYLVHIPIQMTIIAVARGKGIAIPTRSPLFLAGYATAVLGVATLVRYLIEKPASHWLRQRFLKPAAAVTADAVIPASQPAGLSIVGE